MQKQDWTAYRTVKSCDKLPLGVYSVGYYHFPANRRSTHRFVQHLQITWSVKGAGRILLNGKLHPLPQESVAIYLPGMEHLYYSEAEPWEICYLSLDGAEMEHIFRLFGFDLARPLQVGKCPVSLLRRIYQEVTQIGATHERLCSLYAYEMLIHLANNVKSEPLPDADLSLQEEIIACMHRHVSDADVGISQIALELKIDRSVLSRLFHETAGMPPSDYFRAVRLQKAMGMLTGSGEAVGAIAQTCGFTDAKTMSRVFRRELGMTPTEFRERHLKDNR